MDDVQVAPGPGIPLGLTIPAADLQESFSHASGPGGQGVNTTDSRVQLSIDLATTSALTPAQRARVLARLEPRLVGTVLTLSAAEHRSQLRNRRAARERLAALLRDALMPEVTRRATRPTRGSVQRRLAAKKLRSELKATRRPPHG